MNRLWTEIPALFLCLTLLLPFLGERIDDRTRISEQGVTVLMPLVPLGPKDLSHGDLIELVYDAPEVIAQVRSGSWPHRGTVAVTLDSLNVGHAPRLYEGGALAPREVVLAYRFGTTGTDIWPAYRRRLAFGDSFFVLSGQPMKDYAGARYAVLKVDPRGSSIVTGLADASAHPIGAGR